MSRVQLARELASQNGFQLGQWETKIKLLYDYVPQVVLIQHNDANKSTNIFRDQQSQVEDLMEVLWLKKLFVNKNRNGSATSIEQERTAGVSILTPRVQVTEFHWHICGKGRG